MFSFPSHPIFLDPWAGPASRTGFCTGWDCFEPFWLEADAPCRAQARASARAGARPRRDHVCRDELDEMYAFARQARHQARPTQAAPEPFLSRPRSAKQQQQQQQQQQQSRGNDPSTSCNTSSSSSSSYHSTTSDTAEPMDVCFGTASADQPKQQQQQQQQQQHGVRTIPVTTVASPENKSPAHHPMIPNKLVATEQPATELPASLEGNNEDMQQADHSDQLICNTATKPSPEVTSAAATTIQATWRMHKITKHRSAYKQLATAAGQLRNIRSTLSVQLQAAAAAGCALTQKQYLEISEPVMKVLFLLDSVSCGSVVELRNVRKRLTVTANQLLDDIQTAYKQPMVVPLQ